MARYPFYLQLVVLEARPLVRADSSAARQRLENGDILLTAAALGPDVVRAARVVAFLDRLDLHDAAWTPPWNAARRVRVAWFSDMCTVRERICRIGKELA
jgi:hypothetical protein